MERTLRTSVKPSAAFNRLSAAPAANTARHPDPPTLGREHAQLLVDLTEGLAVGAGDMSVQGVGRAPAVYRLGESAGGGGSRWATRAVLRSRMVGASSSGT